MVRLLGTSNKCQQCENCLKYAAGGKKQKCLNPKKELKVCADDLLVREPLVDVTDNKRRTSFVTTCGNISTNNGVIEKENLIPSKTQQTLTRGMKKSNPTSTNPLGYYARFVNKCASESGKKTGKRKNPEATLSNKPVLTFESVVEHLRINECVSERLAKRMKFSQNVQDMCSSRLRDLRTIARRMALKVFEFLSNEPEAVRTFCS